MISFDLICENNHIFTSWFRSSKDYERLQAEGLINCEICQSTHVQKSLMKPSIGKKNNTKSPEISPAEQYYKAMKNHIKSAKNVGWSFANQARAMNEGTKEKANIYGKTTIEDAIELIKDGIEIAPLPFDPDNKDN